MKNEITFQNERIEDIFKIVERINKKLYDIDGLCETFGNVTIETDTNILLIRFLNNTLWNSNEDERFFFENKNEYENLEVHLKMRISEMIDTLRKILV